MTTIHISRVYSGYHATFRGGDFSLCVSTLKSFIPAGLRGYTPATRKWFIDEDATDQMRRWISYAETMIGARVEWQTSSDRKREKPPEPPPAKPKASDPHTTLWLLPGAPAELIKQAYRVLAKLNHPDHGGDTEAMQRINDAYRRLAA